MRTSNSSAPVEGGDIPSRGERLSRSLQEAGRGVGKRAIEERGTLTGFVGDEVKSASKQVRKAAEEFASPVEQFRLWWPSSALPTLLTSWNFLVSLLTVVIYCVNTYYENQGRGMAIIYMAASVSFSVEYILNVLTAKSWSDYVFSVYAVVDFFAIAYGAINFGFYMGDVEQTSFWRALAMIQVGRLFTSISTLAGRFLRKNKNPQQVELMTVSLNLCLTIFGVVFIAGCIFYELNDPNLGGGQQYLHESIYWACVTLSTIGYGDFYPNTAVTQMLLPLMIFFIILLLPWRIGDLTTVLYSINRHMRRRYESLAFGQHVVVMGNFNTESAKSFIDEFYHPDRGYQSMDLVLLLNKEMTADMMCLFASHRAHKKLLYLQGAAFSAPDMERANVTKAQCVFVLCDKHANDQVAEDRNTLMTVLAVAQYLRMNTGVDKVYSWTSASWRERMQQRTSSPYQPLKNMSNIIAQFHLPEYVERAMALLNRQNIHPPEMGMLPVERSLLFPICIGSLKHSLIASSVRSPGLSAVVSNLCMSKRITRIDALGYEKEMVSGMGWLEEFLKGAENEVYELSNFPPCYWGLTFSEACQVIYKEHGAILLGLGDCTGHSQVQLAPHDAKVDEGTYGYVLAKERIALAHHISESSMPTISAMPSASGLIPEQTQERHSRSSSSVSLLGSTSMAKKASQMRAVANTRALASRHPDKESVPMWEVFKEGLTCREKVIFEPKDHLLNMSSPLIIIGKSSFHHLHYLVSAIRAGKLSSRGSEGEGTSTERVTDVPIIIMDPTGPSQAQLAVLRNDANVHFLQAEPRQLIEMNRIGLVAGSPLRAIVLPESGEEWSDEEVGKKPCLADADSIQICSNLLQYSLISGSKLHLITEAVALVNAPYLLSLALRNESLRPMVTGLEAAPHQNIAGSMWNWMQDQSGIYVSRSKDESRERFLRKMISKMPFLSPALSSGHVIYSAFLDHLLCNAFFNPSLVEIITQLIGAHEDQMMSSVKLGRPQVHSVSMHDLAKQNPSIEVMMQTGLQFEHLFCYCLTNRQVAIGLYRTDSETGFQYVMTSPEATTEVAATDSVFVICEAQKLPGPTNW